jgi:quinolinate synthase
LNTLEKIVWALEDMVYQVRVAEETWVSASKAIEGMLSLD